MNAQNMAYIPLRYPKTIILLWTLFILLFGFFAPKLPAVLKDHGLMPDGAYAEVQRILASDFHIPENPVLVVFETKEHVAPEAFLRFIQQTVLQLQGIDGLSEIITPLQREGMLQGNVAYALLAFTQPSHEMEPVLEALNRRLPSSEAISVQLTGQAVVQADVNRASQQDLKKAERIGVAAAFVILWLAFGGIVPAMIPIVVGVVGVGGTMGIMYWLGKEIALSNFVLNVIPMVGLALSIDFALMLVSRFREELARLPAAEALIATMQTAGRAVLFSALSVFLGLMGILFIPLPMFSSIALGAMTMLTVAVLLSLTLVPALLLVLSPAIKAKSYSQARQRNQGFWHSAFLYIMNRPVRMALLAACLLVCCILPLHKMELAIPNATSLPQDYQSRQAFETYQARFVPQGSSGVYIVVQGTAEGWTKEEWLGMYSLVNQLKADPLVKNVNSIFASLRILPEQLYLLFQNPSLKAKYEPAMQPFIQENKMLIQATLTGESSSEEVMGWLRNWEQRGQASAIPFRLGGEAKYQQEVFDSIFDHIKYVLLFILISNYVVLFIAFRSVIIPLKTIAMNLLCLGASFGILAWIFNEGHFGIEPGSIAIMIPVFIFGLVFGISMDYGVFLVSRIYEAYQQSADNERAVLAGLTSISRVITSAAAIMIAVTVPFAFGDVVGVKQLGIGIAVAIFIDATVIRLILIPSLMKLFGKWNWWVPGGLK